MSPSFQAGKEMWNAHSPCFILSFRGSAKGKGQSKPTVDRLNPQPA
jgi:hypothetical protein